MERRGVLKLFAAGALTVALPPVTGCGAGTRLALAPWSGPPAGEGDVRLRALAYAVLAPNAHNTQPWRVALRDDGLDLRVDASRLLPATDPAYRQTHISQGTFLEQLVLAFAALGRSSDVAYFPDGEYPSDRLEPRPVARVRIAPAPPVRDPLFDAIPVRRSNKGLYDPARSVPDDVRAALAAAAGDGVTTRFVDDPAARARLTAICADAMAAEVLARPRDEETAKWFRFSDDEMDQKRDGFGLAQAGRSGLGKWLLETFIVSRASAGDPRGSFAQAAVDLARDQAVSAPCFGALLSPNSTRRTQVTVGRAYARLALAAAASGLSVHPMSQALEEYADVAPVKARIERELGVPSGSTAQMFFRLGYGPATPHAPRRDVRDLLA